MQVSVGNRLILISFPISVSLVIPDDFELVRLQTDRHNLLKPHRMINNLFTLKHIYGYPYTFYHKVFTCIGIRNITMIGVEITYSKGFGQY